MPAGLSYTSPRNLLVPEQDVLTVHHIGHFISPVVNRTELDSRQKILLPSLMPKMHDFESNMHLHLRIFRERFSRHMPAYDDAEHAHVAFNASQFFTGNLQFD